jgi:hypothetical protein
MALTGYLIMTTLACSAATKALLPNLVIPDGFGVNIHFRGESRDLDLIAEAGFRFIRMDLTWGAVEREEGSYDFAGYDALTEGCSKRGIRILYILDYSNRLYESDRSVRTEEGREAFANFAEAAASRYSGQRILWEIWNEPNLNHFWSPQPSVEDYCALVETTVPRIREADSSGLVVAPATSGIPFDWLEDCYKSGLLKWIDALTVHPYRPRPPETVIKDYARLRELNKRYAPEGKEIAIISGEWGYSLINWDRSRLSEEQQAQYLARMFLVNLYEGVLVSIWYDWKDDGTDPNEREHHFGTMTHDLNSKPAYLAAKTLAHVLEGHSVVERIGLAKDEDFALRLRSGQNEGVVFWTAGEEHKATLSVEAGEGVLFSMLGDERAISWSDGRLEVTLSQSPQYVILRE